MNVPNDIRKKLHLETPPNKLFQMRNLKDSYYHKPQTFKKNADTKSKRYHFHKPQNLEKNYSFLPCSCILSTLTLSVGGK